MIAEATGNRLLLHLMQAIRERLTEMFGTVYRFPGGPERSIAQHRLITQAIAAADAEQARRPDDRAHHARRARARADRPLTTGGDGDTRIRRARRDGQHRREAAARRRPHGPRLEPHARESAVARRARDARSPIRRATVAERVGDRVRDGDEHESARGRHARPRRHPRRALAGEALRRHDDRLARELARARRRRRRARREDARRADLGRVRRRSSRARRRSWSAASPKRSSA